MMEAEQIAKGLTDKERHAVSMFRLNATGKLWHFPALRDGGAMRRRMEALGLCSGKGIMTKKGLAVRAAIERKPHDH